MADDLTPAQRLDADNPLGVDGFEFVEFTGPEPQAMVERLELMGFVQTHVNPANEVVRLKQGDISLLVNRASAGQAGEFAREHGPSANGMAFRVADAKVAFEGAVARGARPAEAHAGGALGGDYPYVLLGIGGSLLYLVDRYGEDGSLYDGWNEIKGWQEAERKNGVGLYCLDHLTHNVRRGQMRAWSGFYGGVFNFREQKYFDIKGKATGLFSQAMIAPDRAIRIPLNESQDENSQIEEFLRRYNGEGIQHIAVGSDDIYTSTDAIAERGLKFMPKPPMAYYTLSKTRVAGHEEPLEKLAKHGILIDGEGVVDGRETRILLQIFSKTVIGPIFFEFIQRKGDDGFGEGNFRALFESIEQDQIDRGVLTAS